jgi:hypothetical protein
MSDEPTLAECIAWQERTVRRCQDYATYSAECGEPDEPDATTLRAASAILAHLRRLASAPPDAVWLAVPWEHAEDFSALISDGAVEAEDTARSSRHMADSGKFPNSAKALRENALNHDRFAAALREVAQRLAEQESRTC